ncbi:hypothetical protein FHR32_000981 [Streptosporangium album]|uniref:Uncharacterized protein n=1 Tax=Streptosporangium album TaxID=47479 RepID=A0A7W7W7F3_9ACTN|nr:hypothetical protein [Streptosporangium album]MBB4936676.1 hypothetical protein [Streptosporangium album]
MLTALTSRRIAVAAAGVALLSMTAACGGSGNAALCTEAQQLITSYTSSMASNVGDLEKFNQSNQKLGDDLKALAAKSDGDAASAMNDVAASMSGLKIDAKDPAAAAAALPEFSKKLTEAGVKLQTACS